MCFSPFPDRCHGPVEGTFVMENAVEFLVELSCPLSQANSGSQKRWGFWQKGRKWRMCVRTRKDKGFPAQAILRDKKQARVKKWIDPKKVPQRSLTVRGLWGTSKGLILKGFWAVSYLFWGGSGGPAGEWRGGWRGTSEAYFWRGAVFWRVGWPGCSDPVRTTKMTKITRAKGMVYQRHGFLFPDKWSTIFQCCNACRFSQWQNMYWNCVWNCGCKTSGVRKTAQKAGFGGCSPVPENWNKGTFGCSPVPQKPERGYIRMFPGTKNPERGYIRQNRPYTKPSFCSTWKQWKKCRWTILRQLNRASNVFGVSDRRRFGSCFEFSVQPFVLEFKSFWAGFILQTCHLKVSDPGHRTTPRCPRGFSAPKTFSRAVFRSWNYVALVLLEARRIRFP